MGVVNSMAIYLAPYFEKVASQEVVRNAAIGMQTIAAKTVEIQEVQMELLTETRSSKAGPKM